MSRVEQIEQQITALDQAEFSALREWFAQYDAEVWDSRIEMDANNGKLAVLAESALRDYEEGRATEL